MDEDYYSISSILADNHKLTATFTLDIEGLGYLEGGSEQDIKQHSKAELPFWLAKTLSVNEFTTFPIPPPYSHRVRSALNASAPSVKLSSLVGNNGWWYAWGRRIAGVLDDEQQKELLNTLLRAFTYRLPLLQDLAAHYASSSVSGAGMSVSRSSDGSSLVGEAFRDGMEGEERELFALGQDAGRRIQQWYTTPAGKSRLNGSK